MPFINVSFAEANKTLQDPSFIVQLLKEKKINPKEANLLEKLGLYSRNRIPEVLEEIRTLCEQSFGGKAEDAFQGLSRFIKSQNKRVSWVIFSRTFQSIKYDDRNPLEDYVPRVSEVLTITSKFRIIK
ncbi:MAG: hypothetical protein ACFFFH_06625 [Candidatus Thorarchaeota archaeon]